MPIVLGREKKKRSVRAALADSILNGKASGILKELIAEPAPEIDVDSFGHTWLDRRRNLKLH
jgi:hypothetical protein